MLTRGEIERLLALHSQAYQLLLWLADEATRDPAILSPDALAALREPATAAAWIDCHRTRLPERLLPDKAERGFGALLSSFFATSFDVKHLEFQGRLVESRVNVRTQRQAEAASGLDQCRIQALRHLAAADKTPITERDARVLVRRKSLSEAAFLWTYVWELDRRVRNKGKGPVVHRIWRSLPKELRKSLSADLVWKARERLLSAVREHCEAG
jgi:hypothetical protein